MRQTIAVAATAILLTLSVANAATTCLRGSDIDYTDRPDDKTVVFHMKDRTVYRNDLPVRCPGLKVSIDGFTYAPTDPGTDELCDNLGLFRLNDVGHASCIFGKFTKVK